MSGGLRSLRAGDGTRLAYRLVGSGPLLVCHPGGPGRAAAYLEDLGGLAATRTLVLLDSRGTGASEVPSDPSTLRFDRLADDVEALREHLGEERLDLLGHSAGALVAQAYAGARPERVRALVLVTPSGRLQGHGHDDVPEIRAGSVGEEWYAEAADAVEAYDTADPGVQRRLSRSMRPFYYGRWDERTSAHAATADAQMAPRAALGFGRDIDHDAARALLAGLATLRAPCLVVAGERDGMTGVSGARQVAAGIAGARVEVLPGAGHFPWVDAPDAVRDAVEGFLAQVPLEG